MSSMLQYNTLTNNVQRTQLANGLTILTKEVHTNPIVTAMIWYRVGARDEELGQTGKSHFLEHMLFKGTDKYKKGAIDLITMQNGGRNNAFTWLDFTAYYFTFASDRWETALEIESSRMRNTLFTQEEFDSEKQVVIEELQIGQDGPWDALEEEIWATAFRQHPYHNPTVGWIEDLLVADKEAMKAYYDKWYHPQNATLVLVGDFQTETALARINELFGAIPAGPPVERHKIVEPPQKGEKRVVIQKSTPVERLMMGYHAPQIGHPDTYALHVVAMIMSAGRRSRFYQRLQEQDRSVTYARASYNEHIDPTLFYIQAEVKPGYLLADVEASILEIIQDLTDNPVSEQELAKARRQNESNFILGNENLMEQATLLGQFETIAHGEHLSESEQGYHYLTNYLTNINSVTASDIQRVMRTYFIPKNRTVGYLVSDPNASEVDGADASEAEETSEVEVANRYPERPMGWSTILAEANFNHSPTSESQLEPLVSRAEAIPVSPSVDLASPTLDIERVVLDNGIVLLLGENHTIPAISINAVVGTGSRYETDEQAGLASLLGDMLDEGTTTRTAQQLAETIEQVGGHLQSFGGYGQSGVSTTILTPDLDLGLELTADVLMNATIPLDRFEQQRERRLAQLKSRNDDPRVVASDLFNEVLYQGHPAHRPKAGYEATIKNLTRETLLDFYHYYFAPNNTMIAIVGDIDKAEIKRKVAKAFANWSPKEFSFPPIPAITRQTAPVKKFVHKDKEQINIYIGHLGIERSNPDYYALVVLDTILGSSPGFTSRIPRILRDEQGLAYSTYSNITSSAGVDAGRFVAYIGTSPENLVQATTGIMQEIRRITVESITEDELKDAIAYLTGSFVFHFETNAQIAGFLVEAEVFKLGFDHIRRYPKLIRAVTCEDVLRVAQKYIDPDNLTTVIVGPINENGQAKEN